MPPASRITDIRAMFFVTTIVPYSKSNFDSMSSVTASLQNYCLLCCACHCVMLWSLCCSVVIMLYCCCVALLLFVLSYVLIVCTVPLPTGVNRIAVDKYSYTNINIKITTTC